MSFSQKRQRNEKTYRALQPLSHCISREPSVCGYAWVPEGAFCVSSEAPHPVPNCQDTGIPIFSSPLSKSFSCLNEEMQHTPGFSGLTIW